VYDVLDSGCFDRSDGATEDGRREDVAHGDKPGRVDRVVVERRYPGGDPGLVPAAKGDDVGVEADVGVAEVTDSVGGTKRGVSPGSALRGQTYSS
jgi:hypothetical protein